MSREEILDILGRKCDLCGSKENLHIHHKLPHWLWRYVGKTDGGNFSVEFIDNYEVLCNECHKQKHAFLNKNLVKGFKYHYSLRIRWKRSFSVNIYPYTVYVDEDQWQIITMGDIKWIWEDSKPLKE